jgi:hypothetical protein
MSHPSTPLPARLAAFGALALLPFCHRGGAPAPTPAAAAPKVTPVAATLVYYDNGGGVRDSLRLVVRDAAALNEVWTKATSRQGSPPAVPQADFAKEMFLVVSNGRMTPEDQIRVDSVTVQERAGSPASLEAIVHTLRGCGRFNTDAYPVAIVRVPRVEGTVQFTDRREKAECGAE